MSRKQIYGITLNTEERRMAGYDRTPGAARMTTAANVPPPKAQYAGLTSHTCLVTLPDGAECRVDYTCYSGGSHTFYFHPPLSEREYGNGSLADKEGIRARAQELVGRVWRKAQEAEQKSMRLPSAPSNLVHTLDKAPQLTRKTAQRFAGLYSVCMRYPSGTLTPLSLACEQRSEALRDLARMQAEGGKQTLVIGLCCRWARRWQEPRFLTDAPAEANMPGTMKEMTSNTVVKEEGDTNANGSPGQHTEEEEERAWAGDEESDLDEDDPDEPDPDDDDENEDDSNDPFEGT